MSTQVDEDGYTVNFMEGIINCKKDETYLFKEDIYVVTNRRRKWYQKKTVGWNLLVQWKYNYDSCIHLKYMKQSHPI